MKNIFQQVQLIIFDLDGTLYEDTDHFQHYAHLLQSELPTNVQKDFQRDYNRMILGRHIVQIGKVYDYENDVILEVNPYTLHVRKGWSWCGKPINIRNWNRPVKLNFDTMIAIGDGWWLPHVCAKHYGHKNPQNAYDKTKVFMASNRFSLSKIPDLKDSLLHLKNKRQIVLMTNSDLNDAHRLLYLLDLEEVFDEVVASARKPEFTLKHFNEISEKHQLDPKLVLSVGDNFLNDIAPAVTLGMQTIFIDAYNFHYPEYTGLKVGSLSDTTEMMQAVQ